MTSLYGTPRWRLTVEALECGNQRGDLGLGEGEDGLDLLELGLAEASGKLLADGGEVLNLNADGADEALELININGGVEGGRGNAGEGRDRRQAGTAADGGNSLAYSETLVRVA